MARPRVLISTDIGGNDRDDSQSMVHAMLYADKLDYRGFVVTRTDDGGVVNGRATSGASVIREIIDAYAKDLPNLRSHSAGYASADSLRSKIAVGSTNDAFPGKLSEGAQLIIDEARRASPNDPLWVLAWGPIHDVAAALLRAPDIVPNVRLYSIAGYGQDKANTKAFYDLRAAVAKSPAYDDLFWINAESTFRGIMVDAKGNRDAGIRSSYGWLEDNVDGKGALGELFFEKYAHNIHQESGGSKMNGLKMGDTPSLLYLIDRAADGNPGASSWGGRFRPDPIGEETWTDRTEASLKMGTYLGARTVYEHRGAFREDFANRLEWADARKTASLRTSASSEIPGSDAVVSDVVTVSATTFRPNVKGKVWLNGGKLEAGAVTRVADLDFGEEDTLIFHRFDAGTFRGVAGGNRLQVSEAGGFALVDSVADLRELVGASEGVGAIVDLVADRLTLMIEHDGGVHALLLEGLGRDYAAGAGDSLL